MVALIYLIRIILIIFDQNEDQAEPSLDFHCNFSAHIFVVLNAR